MFNLGFLDSYRDNGGCRRSDSPIRLSGILSGPARLHRKGFRRDADGVLKSLGVTTDDFAAFGGH